MDAVLVNIGFNNSLGPIKDWGLALEGGQIKVTSMMQTSRPGVFAAGDVRSGSIKRVASAVGEGAMAVRMIHEYLALLALA